MASDFQTMLNNRKYESFSTIKGVKIIEKSCNLFYQVLEEALDQLYEERLLEIGKCIVCQSKTSKCCSHCGTHYCSIDCQIGDWPRHKLTCLSSQSEIPQNLRHGKPEQSEVKKNITNVHDNRNTELNSANQSIDVTDGQMKQYSGHGSFQDVSIVGKNREDEQNNGKSGTENWKNTVGNTEKFNGPEQKYDNQSERNEKNESRKKFVRKPDSKKYVPLQKLMVKRLTADRKTCWVIEKNDEEKFEKIQETLELECSTYPAVSVYSNDIFAMKFNQKWHRCKLLFSKPKPLIRCVDTGQTFSPKLIRAVELPDYLKEEDGLAFRVAFMDTVLEGEWLSVQVVRVLPNGCYEVRLCEEKKKGKKMKGENKEAGVKSKVDQNKNKKDNEEVEILEKVVQKRSVIDELQVGTKGIFLPMKITKDSLVGCLAADDVDEAMCSYNRITGLYIADEKKIDVDVGADVMVAGEDTTGLRGMVKSKSGKMYKVRLVDYGSDVETEEVYELPEKTADLMQLACEVTLLDNHTRRYDEFEVKRAYVFEVTGKKSNGDWVCNFATYPDLHEILAIGIVKKPWKRKRLVFDYVPFEDGCKVLITGVGSSNDVHIKHVAGKWDEPLDQLNLKLNTGSMKPDLPLEEVQTGDIILSKYKYDELWYRAKVIQKRKDSVKVVFVDYGNFQFSSVSQLRRLPEGINEPFFSRKVILAGSKTGFSPKGREYLTKFKDDEEPVILMYTGEDLSDGVNLVHNGTNLNEIAFEAEEKTDKEVPPKSVFDNGVLIKDEGFEVGTTENFICAYVEKNEFLKNGVFWAVNSGSNNFKSFIELESELSKANISTYEEFSPEVGDLCLVQFKGSWYRGQVRNAYGSHLEVFFIDFGDSHIIGSRNVRKIIPEFFKIPAVAIKCILNGFSKLDTEMKMKAYSFISANLYKPVENGAVIVKAVDNEHYVEFKTELVKDLKFRSLVG